MTLRSLGHSLIYLALLAVGRMCDRIFCTQESFSMKTSSAQAMGMNDWWGFYLTLDKNGSK